MSWAELSSRAGAVAAGLTLHRSTRGRIGILGRDRAGWVCTAYGAALAGLAVVPMPSAEPDEALARELQEFVKKTIAPYKYPRAVEFRSSLPRTETGKLQRFKLRQAP